MIWLAFTRVSFVLILFYIQGMSPSTPWWEWEEEEFHKTNRLNRGGAGSGNLYFLWTYFQLGLGGIAVLGPAVLFVNLL